MITSRNKRSTYKNRSRRTNTNTRRKPKFRLKKGGLTKYGYSLKNNMTDREKALRQAMKYYPYSTLISKLNVLVILHKNKNPLYSRRAAHDMKFIQRNREKIKNNLFV